MIKSRMKWVGNVARMGEINSYEVLVVKPEGKIPLGISRSRWILNRLRKQCSKVCIGFIWLKLWNSGRLL
jgi:hypothetical protein